MLPWLIWAKSTRHLLRNYYFRSVLLSDVGSRDKSLWLIFRYWSQLGQPNLRKVIQSEQEGNTGSLEEKQILYVHFQQRTKTANSKDRWWVNCNLLNVKVFWLFIEGTALLKWDWWSTKRCFLRDNSKQARIQASILAESNFRPVGNIANLLKRVN